MIIANHPAVVEWVQERVGVKFLEPFTSMGFLQENKLTAGIVFHMWTACDVEMGASIIPGGITRRDLKEVAHYVFEREGKRRVTLKTPVSNAKARAIAKRLGFEEECILKDYYPNEDGVMFRLLKQDCRWS